MTLIFQPTSSPRIVLFDTARPGVDPGEELIRAYWLPWKSGKTLQLELRPGVNYFFTSHLGGCELRIVPPAGVGTHTKVLHIAGDTGGEGNRGKGPGGIEWRAKQAAELLRGPSCRGRRHSRPRSPIPTVTQDPRMCR